MNHLDAPYCTMFHYPVLKPSDPSWRSKPSVLIYRVFFLRISWSRLHVPIIHCNCFDVGVQTTLKLGGKPPISNPEARYQCTPFHLADATHHPASLPGCAPMRPQKSQPPSVGERHPELLGTLPQIRLQFLHR